MRRHPSVKLLIGAAFAGIVLTGFLTRAAWLPIFQSGKRDRAANSSGETNVPTDKVILTDHAQENLGLRAKPIKPQPFWKTIQVPGMVVDLPGRSDRAVVAPANGLVVKVARLPGDVVRPREELFTFKLMSEGIHQAQTGLFKTTLDIKLARDQRKRLEVGSGALPASRLIEADNQITRLEVAAKVYRQELLSRGLPPELVESAAEGEFMTEIPILAPADGKTLTGPLSRRITRRIVGEAGDVSDQTPLAFEVQELKVELGQQVQTGQTLCVLANHRSLAIEGRAFRDEMPYVERSAEQGWPAEIDFGGEHPADRDALLLVATALGMASDELGQLTSPALLHTGTSGGWFPPPQDFTIRRISPTIDPDTRTFTFLLPLENQSRPIERDGSSRTRWSMSGRPAHTCSMYSRRSCAVPFSRAAMKIASRSAASLVMVRSLTVHSQCGIHGQITPANPGYFGRISSVRVGIAFFQFGVEPGPRVSPVAVCCCGGNAKHLRRLGDGQPNKVAQFDQLRLDWIDLLKALQGLVQGQQIQGGVRSRDLDLFQRLAFPGPAAPLAMFVACLIDEDAAHSLGGSGEEVAPAVPVLGLVAINQTQVGLMDQGRGLKCLSWLLLCEFLRREPTQLLVDQGQQLLGGRRVALLDGRQDARDLVAHGRHLRWPQGRECARV
jgi:hypothetical protein